MGLAELPVKSGDADFLRAVAEAVLQMPMERIGKKTSRGDGRRATNWSP